MTSYFNGKKRLAHRLGKYLRVESIINIGNAKFVEALSTVIKGFIKKIKFSSDVTISNRMSNINSKF